MAPNADQKPSYFRDAYENRVDITDRYLAIGDVPELLRLSPDDDRTIIKAVRDALTRAGGFDKCTKLAEPEMAKARALYLNDRIAAIDGTSSISPTRLVTETVYGAGVVAVSPGSHNRPRTKATTTRAAAELDTAEDHLALAKKIKSWAKRLQGAREDESSWTGTFREYEERELAAELLESGRMDTVLIDGPILTQNLLSQAEGRNLLKRLTERGQAIGFIKDLSANPIIKTIGLALERDETYTVPNWKELLSERFQTGQGSIARWVEEHAERLVRVVYKRRRRAYCVECRADRINLAFSILAHDCVGPTDHDIPLLLHVADSQVRRIFQGDQARDELIARYAWNEPNRLVELIAERELR